MKYILILILSFNFVFGLDFSENKDINIWNTLISFEKNYTTLLKNDNNSSRETILLNQNLKFKKDILSYLKNNKQYNLSNNNKFFNDLKFTNRTAFLNRRIENNGYSNNIIAIHRDMFELYYLTIKKNIVETILFFDKIEKKDSSFKKKLLKKINQQILFLDKYNPSDFNDFIHKNLITEHSSLLEREALNKFFTYKIIYFLYKDLLTLIIEENKISIKEQLLEELYINRLIYDINNNSFIKLDKFNYFLKPLNLDIGRLIGFLTLLLLFTVIGKILNKFIVDRFTKKINKKIIDKEEQELIHLAFFKIKLPFLILMAISSFHISLWVLYLNTEPNLYIKIFLHSLYIISISWFLFTLIDIFALILINSKKYIKKFKRRKELVNLSILSIKTFLIIVSFIFLLHFWGVNVSGILTGLGIGGIAIALAAKDLLSNFFGTISIIINDIYSQGEWIEVNGEEGTVAELNFGSTKIRTFSNGLISIPNHIMANSTILNWNRRTHGRQIKTILGLTYQSNRDNLVKAIEDINNYLEHHPDIATPNKSYEGASKEKKNKLISVEDTYGIKRTLFVKFIGFSASSVDILIYAYSKTVNWGEFMNVRQEVLLNIWKIIEDNELEFAYPTQTLFLENNQK